MRRNLSKQHGCWVCRPTAIERVEEAPASTEKAEAQTGERDRVYITLSLPDHRTGNFEVLIS